MSKIKPHLLFLVKAFLMLLFTFALAFAPISPATAEISEQCELRQESFGFDLENYFIEHHGWAILNITVDFRYVDAPQAEPENYIDFVSVSAEIDRFLKEYPNEKDYWEIMNRNLAETLLEKYVKISSLRLDISVEQGSSNDPFGHRSVITLTREDGCPLTH